MHQIVVLRHEDLPTGSDPMGESLIHQQEQSWATWINPEYCVVLGATQKPEVELQVEHCQQDHLRVYKRRGGGGTVLLGPRGFCYGLRLAKDPNMAIHDYFELGTGLLSKVLAERLGVESSPRGISDLCIGHKKILGCSLYMPRDYVLYLASVLWADEAERISRYLAHPSREPDYRAGRPHSDFVTCLQNEIPNCPDQNWFMEALNQEAEALGPRLHRPK